MEGGQRGGTVFDALSLGSVAETVKDAARLKAQCSM